MDYKLITENYYSKWLGQDSIISDSNESISFLYSEERNISQAGYANPFDIWILLNESRLIVSYGKKAESRISLLKRTIVEHVTPNQIVRCIANIYNKNPTHGIKYVYNTVRTTNNIAVILKDEHYSKYVEFFKENNPNCTDVSWLYDYYSGMTNSHTCCGVFENDCLVSCTDSPDMPYISDLVQEIGINTVKKYRGKGYATDACILCANVLVERGMCPQWSTDSGNISSQKLSENVGFIKYADYITLTI